MSLFSFLNPITQPFGFKLGGGGPYADKGQGDQALNAAAPLAPAGNNLLQHGQDILPIIYEQLAKLTGTTNPYATAAPAGGAPPLSGAQTGAPAQGPGYQAPTQDPYQLQGTFALQHNNASGAINAARANELSKLQADLGARGLSNSSIQAATMHLNDLFDSHVQNSLATEMKNQQDTQTNTLNTELNNAMSQIGQGGNLINSAVGVHQNQAQANNQMTNQANQALGSTIGAIAGGGIPIPGGTKLPGGLPGYGTPPIVGTNTTNAEAFPGAGLVGGMGLYTPPMTLQGGF